METTAKRELARAIRDTHRIREESYEPRHDGRVGRYRKDYWQAAIDAKVDADLQLLVVPMLQSHYSDFLEWADGVLAHEKV